MTELTVPVQEIWMSQIMTSEMHRHTMSVKKKYTVTKILSRKEVHIKDHFVEMDGIRLQTSGGNDVVSFHLLKHFSVAPGKKFPQRTLQRTYRELR